MAALAGWWPALAGCASSSAARVNEALGTADERGHEAPLEVPMPISPVLLADPGYEIGPGDVLTVQVHHLLRLGEAATFDVTIDAEGTIALPIVGRFVARGRTAAALRDDLVERLRQRDILPDAQIHVAVKEHGSRPVHVTGAVKSPGIHFLQRARVPVLEALSLAGGPLAEAGRIVRVLRPGREVEPGVVAPPLELEVDWLAALEGDRGAASVTVEGGDTLVVAEARPYFVHGFVRRPGAFPLRRSTTVLQAVTLAGGLVPLQASPTEAFVKRPGPGGSVEIIPIDILAVVEGEEPDIVLAAGDHLEVPQTTLRAVAWETWNLLKGRVADIGFNAAVGR